MIIFLYGADTYRSRRFLQDLQTKFTRDVDPNANSISVVDGQNATLKEIAEKVNTGSLFVKKRMVIIENIFKNKKEKIFSELADYLKKLTSGEETVIIFLEEELDNKEKSLKADAKKLFAFLLKQQFVQEFHLLAGSHLVEFVKKEFREFGKEVESSTASLLISLTNGEPWSLSREIKKLTFRATAKNVTADDVKEMTSGSYDENIFALTDALSAKNKKMALKLLEEQYAAGLSDEYLITMLTRQFKILLQLHAAGDKTANPAAIASQLKIHPFVVKKGLSQAKNFSADDLKNLLNRLIRLDFLNKTGQGDIKTELTMLISSL